MSIKVLVADDSITIQKVIGIIFGGDEYSLTIVDNGSGAVAKAREIVPDILLIDALMPGMNGYEVTEAVRATPSLATKPILILTGSFEPFDEDKARKSGADDFIAKPFESQQIISKVRELLELGKLRDRSLQPSQPQPVEILREEAPVPVFAESAPVFAQQAVTPQPSAPSDIWGAFTTMVEPPVTAAATPPPPPFSAAPFETEEFAVVGEENEAQLVQTASAADTSLHHASSQWDSIEENTFEFEEETIAKPAQTPFTEAESSLPPLEASFGDIEFCDEPPSSETPAFPAVSEPAFAVPAQDFADFSITAPDITEQSVFEELQAFEDPPAFAPIPAADTAPAAPAPLSEEQLKAAITVASKDVIERIVWEVVPDLAEAMIREAIRKIKEGA